MNFIVRLCLNFALIVISSRHTYSREAKLRCQNERVHNMLAFNCADMKLNEIPKYLSTKIEVKIRKAIEDVWIIYSKKGSRLIFRFLMHPRIE